MQNERRVLTRLIASEIGGQSGADIAAEKLEVIGSILDPSTQVYAPHHIVRRIFEQTDKTLALMHEGQQLGHDSGGYQCIPIILPGLGFWENDFEAARSEICASIKKERRSF